MTAAQKIANRRKRARRIELAKAYGLGLMVAIQFSVIGGMLFLTLANFPDF